MSKAHPQYPLDPSIWVEGDHPNWTSDPSKVQDGGYFDNTGTNLAKAFDIDGLGPILRKTCGPGLDLTHTFLLKDKFGNYYVADLDMGGTLRAYVDAHLKEEAEVVQNVLAGLHERDMVHFTDERFYEPRIRQMKYKRGGSD